MIYNLLSKSSLTKYNIYQRFLLISNFLLPYSILLPNNLLPPFQVFGGKETVELYMSQPGAAPGEDLPDVGKREI